MLPRNVIVKVLRRVTIAVLFCWSLGCVSAPALAQSLPLAGDSRQSMLREAMLGVLPAQANVAAARARKQCVTLPVRPANDRFQGPHGDSLVDSHCEVVSYQTLDGPQARWITALYRWTSLFTAEDKARGPSARDTVTEDEAVLFEAIATGQVRPVWHERIETGEYAVWRSLTPELAWTSQATILLSVRMCLNGTGGCSQEFLQRHADGRWYGVRQDWLDQLPAGFIERIRHGIRIDPSSLRGEAGFYGDRDPNCCPSQRLLVDLELRGDLLVLRRQTVVAEP
jgi:hypothetical protein